MSKKYRVILTVNDAYRKTLHRSDTRGTTFKHYHIIKDENHVLFPRRFVNSNGITPVKYRILMTKIWEEGDTKRILRDEFGKLYEEPQIGDWTILDSAPYEIEETFWLYGKNPTHERVTIKEIMPLVTKGAYKKYGVKQITVVHNKLVIYSEEQFDMVICKCEEDAQRLHHALAKTAKKLRLKNILFMGTVNLESVSRMYDIIYENTDWTIEKIRRTSTKP